MYLVQLIIIIKIESTVELFYKLQLISRQLSNCASVIFSLIVVLKLTVCGMCRQHRGKITGLLFNPSSTYLYSCSSVGSLALHDAHDDKYQLMRLLGTTVARGDTRGAQALTISEDGRQLAFVGPTDLTISVVDAKSLDEVWSLLSLLHCLQRGTFSH